MKTIKILFGTLMLVLLLGYVILFTSVNKSIIVPVIENTISKSIKVENIKIDKFELSLGSLDMSILINNQVVKLNSTFDLLSKYLDLTYDVNFTNLSIFNKISGQKLQGTFKTNGNLKGEFNDLNLIGNAYLAKGDISYNLNISNNDVNNIIANIKNIKIEELLFTISQPKYAKADLNIDVNIKSLNNFNGNIITIVSNGILNKKLVKNDFNISLPLKPIFTLNAATNLNKNIISTKTAIKTFAANMNTSKTNFDLETSKLTTDYSLLVSDLSNLFFITNQKMRGDIKIDGDIKFKDSLTASFNSNKFDGKINGTLEKDKINLSIKDINSLQLLNMMYYPEIYNSKINLALNYNLKSKKGTSNLTMKDGKFLTNQLSQTIKKFIKKDLTKELYEIAQVKTKINDKKLNSTLLMTSKNSKISSDKLFIDLEKSTINSDIDLEYYKYKIGLTLKDDLTSPTVKINVNKLLKSKAKTKVSEAIEKKLGDKLDDDTKKALGGFLNKFF